MEAFSVIFREQRGVRAVSTTRRFCKGLARDRGPLVFDHCAGRGFGQRQRL